MVPAEGLGGFVVAALELQKCEVLPLPAGGKLTEEQWKRVRSLTASVQLWERAYEGDWAHPRNCIEEDASTMMATSRRLGLEMPQLERLSRG